VLVTDIRMPPSFQREGIDAAKELRKRHPGTGVVVLSQYDDPRLRHRPPRRRRRRLRVPAQGPRRRGNQLRERCERWRRAARSSTPRSSKALLQPVTDDGGLPKADEQLLHEVAEGRPIKAIAAARGTTAASVADEVEALFLKAVEGRAPARPVRSRALRMSATPLISRPCEEQGERLSRLLPGGLAEKVRSEGRAIGETEELVVTV